VSVLRGIGRCVRGLVHRPVRVFLEAVAGGLPTWQTVYGWLRRWKARGFTERILEELREQIGIAEGCEPEPSAGVIDSQSSRVLRGP
jgi:transposase